MWRLRYVALRYVATSFYSLFILCLASFPNQRLKEALLFFLLYNKQYTCTCTYGREGQGGERGAKSYLRPRESLALYKSFNTLWYSLWAGLRVVFPGVSGCSCHLYAPPPPPPTYTCDMHHCTFNMVVIVYSVPWHYICNVPMSDVREQSRKRRYKGTSWLIFVRRSV